MSRNLWPASRAFVLIGLIAMLLLTACQATADVAIDVQPDGSGTVALTLTLDTEAAGRLGDDLTDVIRTDDLAAAGWQITGPAVADEETVLGLTKPFANPSELGPIIDEISGPDGPFKNFALASSDRFTKTTYTLDGEMNLTGSLDQFSDSAVAELLDGFATGRTPEELEQELLDNPESLSLALSVQLPGTLQNSGSLPGSESYSERWTLGTGVPDAAKLQLVSHERDISSAWWVIGGAVCLGLAGILIIRRPKSPATDLVSTDFAAADPALDSASDG